MTLNTKSQIVCLHYWTNSMTQKTIFHSSFFNIKNLLSNKIENNIFHVNLIQIPENYQFTHMTICICRLSNTLIYNMKISFACIFIMFFVQLIYKPLIFSWLTFIFKSLTISLDCASVQLYFNSNNTYITTTSTAS